jgi:hypothetical protein
VRFNYFGTFPDTTKEKKTLQPPTAKKKYKKRNPSCEEA